MQDSFKDNKWIILHKGMTLDLQLASYVTKLTLVSKGRSIKNVSSVFKPEKWSEI